MTRTIQFFVSVICVLFIISFSVTLTLNSRLLYKFDVLSLDIEHTSGYNKETILKNHNELICYNSIFGPNELHFSDFPISKTGQIHFKEVKQVFVSFQIILIVSFAILLFSIKYLLKNKQYDWLKMSAWITLLLPLLLIALISSNWDSLFERFHKIVFNNDFWLFDPATDPIIKILPDTYFLHCAIMIAAIIILFCILAFSMYYYLKKKQPSI